MTLPRQSIKNYSNFVDIINSKTKIRQMDKVFHIHKKINNNHFLKNYLPILEKFEEEYFKNLEINLSKFEIPILLKEEQLEPQLEKINFENLFSNKILGSLDEKSDSNETSRNKEIHKLSQTKIQEEKIDKDFGTLFGEENEDDSDFVQDQDLALELGEIKYQFKDNNKCFLKDTYIDMYHMEKLESMFDFCDQENINVKVFDTFSENHINIIQLNQEEMNYKGRSER
jgi:hypothetical protein